MTPAVYAPDATGVPALWPWMLALPPRDHCATRGCTARPPKPRHGDAPADAVWCAACRVPVGPQPCAAAGCTATAKPMRASRYRELEPYCPRCRHRGHVALIRRRATRETIAAYLGAGGAP